MEMIPDFGERLDPWGNLIDEFWSALIMVPPEAESAAIEIAIGICDARLGKAPDWARALKRYKPTGAPN